MKISIKNLAILTTVSAALLSGVAYAKHHSGERGDRGPRAEMMFQQMDSDADGKVTVGEMKALAAKRFGERDLDGDGTVTRADRQAKRAERRAERFAKIDADSDGMISQDEFTAFTPERGMRGERRGMRGHHGHRGGRHMGRGMRGVLTLEEAEARAERRFARIDSDEKGYFTLNDLKAFQADRPRRGHRHGAR